MVYNVTIKEVWARTVQVEADSKEDALIKAAEFIEAASDVIDMEYSHTLAPDRFTVFNVDKDTYEQ